MHPIIALWSHPRSMSTAMERIMRERGDFRCFHEPFMYLYYVGDAKKAMPHFDVPEGTPTSYDDIRSMLLDAAQEGPVFFKDMSYYILDRMREDLEFSDSITHTFLIRDPAKSLVSYYKLDPNFSLEEVGIETQYQHFQWLQETYGTTPVVIEAADVQNDTDGMIRAYCNATGMEFLPHSLQWGDEVPKGWEGVVGWHGDVMGSGSIKKDSDKNTDPSAVTLDSDPRLRACYDHHRPFYEALQRHKLTPLR
ncbi:MAG: hypothetical protein HN644_07800 [Rhodospirillales bacterium]|jgi:hypothetical protein|nr:hypothetical protein [Rhodospirillales bacterium]MBT6826586.1 hypothetical protein [Rhodospirillales bacterium]MBT7147839.1 hypothetical protein [Rhodospirillales bacterium]MBT7506163.1 hypothetical protein [Rhodospirillales bacterium]